MASFPESPDTARCFRAGKTRRSPEGFWYDQENDEFILLLQGEATLEFEDGMREMKAGDYLIIPKNCKHRIAKSSLAPACVWLCVFDLD